MPTVSEIDIMTTDLNDNEIKKCFECCSEYDEVTNFTSTDASCICIKQEIEVCDALNKSELDIEIELCEELLNSEPITCTLNFDKENLSDLSDFDSQNKESEVVKNTVDGGADPVKNPGSINIEPTETLLDATLDLKNPVGENPQDSTCNSSEIYQQENNEETKSTNLINNEVNMNKNNYYSKTGPANTTNNRPVLDKEFDFKNCTEEKTTENKFSSCDSPEKYSPENNEDILSVDLDEYNQLDEEDEVLSLIDETDVSTIEEFDMSILEVSDNENNPDNSEGEEEVKKTVSSVVVKPEPAEAIYINEKEDIFDPMWDNVKQLSTNEERYIQVRNCWQSKTIPDPNKNLTYHSYRKRHFKDVQIHRPKQHKRTASRILNKPDAKRSRSCTYHIDNRIQTKCDIKEKKSQKLWSKMNNEISQVNSEYQQEVQRQFGFNPRYNYNVGQLRLYYENQISSIRSRYQQRANSCIGEVETEINALSVARNEVLQFNSFYKGLNSQNDPTVLTFEQHMELEEIENIYSQFNMLYKK